jgi:regulator of protease activity HflC (stomatin/prohibitin superfamily)
MCDEILEKLGNRGVCFMCCCVLFFSIGIPLITTSFEYVQYNQLAFPKNTLTNKVDQSEVFTNGRYFLGPNVDLVTFKSTYQKIEFAGDNALQVFNSEGLSVELDASFYFKIQAGNLQKMFTAYGTNIITKALDIAESTLKNNAVTFTIEQYLKNRAIIAQTFNRNLTKAMSSIYLDVEDHKFQMRQITFPEQIRTKYLDAAVVLQREKQYQFEQEAKLIRDNTDKMTKSTKANTTVITREAEAKSARIVAVAKAHADQLVSTARGKGIAIALSNLTISDPADRKMFIKLMAILDNPSTKIVDSNINILMS